MDTRLLNTNALSTLLATTAFSSRTRKGKLTIGNRPFFEVLHQDSGCLARRAVLTTAHGSIQTPAFMPVGTAGAVKGITPQQLEESGADIILANTYHLLLRPGIDVVESLGGIHKFMAWQKPVLTDSGGYQIFSLSQVPKRGKRSSRQPLTKINDDGVEFISHVDGAKIYLTAEIATKIQNRLASDIIMCLDQCTAFGCPTPQLKEAVERTIRWASVCKSAHSNPGQLLFAVVQGGIDPSLRRRCASELVELGFDGYAIGGLSVGEGHGDMIRTVSLLTGFPNATEGVGGRAPFCNQSQNGNPPAPILPQHRPRYLMGVGTPTDIIAAVRAGVDMFDCVLPTRNARNAFAFTDHGPVRLRNSAHISSTQSIDADCDCYCCRNFTRSAVRHFFNVGEMLGPILVSLHNLRFYQRLMAKIRQAIERDRFAPWAHEQLKK